MTTTEQKAKLLDEFITEIQEMRTSDKYMYEINLSAKNDKLIKDYNSINPASLNPYIYEVFRGRLLNWLIENIESNAPKLSDCPHVSYLANQRGLGMKSLSDYQNVMSKYGHPKKRQMFSGNVGQYPTIRRK